MGLQIVCLITAITCLGAESPEAVVNVRIVNPSNADQEDIPVTFGHVFRQGDIQEGVITLIGDRAAPVQVDVKRRYDDGSVRFAVFSLVVPELDAGEILTLTLANGNSAVAERSHVVLEDLLRTDFDAEVVFQFPNGERSSVSTRRLLEMDGADAGLWLDGPVATEWIVSGPPVDVSGRSDPDLNVQFLIRYYSACGATRVSITTENCWDDWAEALGYDVIITSNDKEVFSKTDVAHRRLSRWRKTFWAGRSEQDVHIVHDLDYISSTGALPCYDTTLDIAPAEDWRERIVDMEGPNWEIMGRGALTAYMPTTGGRPELAPYPEWTVRYLMTMNPRYKAMVLNSGDLAGSWPIHVRSRRTDRIMTIDDRPEFWLDPRGQDKPTWKSPRSDGGLEAEKLTPDLAHQGSFAYVPYLVTGDYYYLEEAYFWANYCLLATWNHPRGNEAGILSGQVRSNAWALRNIADAASIAPDGDAEGAYFDDKIRNNINDRIERMSNPPLANPLGFWHLRTTENSRIQNPADPDWMIIAPWEHDYLIWSFHHLVELGYEEASKPRDSLLRWRVGALTHPEEFNPAMATPYRMVVGRRTEEGRIIYFDDWKTIAAENAQLYEPGMTDSGAGYSYSARAAVVCGVDGGFPDADEALETIERLLPNNRDVMAREPYWPIRPNPGD